MRISRIVGILAAGAMVASVNLLGATEAGAVTACSSSYHCYGIDQLEGNGSYPNAAGTDLYVNCLSVANRNTEFADWEMWYATNTPQVSYDTWVEEGMTAGTLQGGYVGFMWYWADMRPNGTYYEHYIRNASVGTTTNVSVYYAGSDNDNVYLGGSYVGTSTGNGSGGLYAEAGSEVTTTATTVEGTSNNFQYRNSSGWHWASPNVYDNSGGLWSTYASGSYLSVDTGCGAAKPRPAQPKPAPMPAGARTNRRLVAIARHLAALTHDSHPTAIRMTRSTRRTAIRVLSGDKVTGNQAVYVVQLHGTFRSFRRAPQHKSGRIPAGHTLTVVVSAATGQITDWGISNTGAKLLAQLGHVTVLR